MIPLLATDAPTVDMAAWGPALFNGGVVLAVLFWLGRWLVPKLLDANAAQLQAFREEMKAERESHAADLSAQRQHDATGRAETHQRIDALAQEFGRAGYRSGQQRHAGGPG